MLVQYDIAEWLVDLPEDRLEKGLIGVTVEVYRKLSLDYKVRMYDKRERMASCGNTSGRAKELLI